MYAHVDNIIFLVLNVIVFLLLMSFYSQGFAVILMIVISCVASVFVVSRFTDVLAQPFESFFLVVCEDLGRLDRFLFTFSSGVFLFLFSF